MRSVCPLLRLSTALSDSRCRCRSYPYPGSKAQPHTDLTVQGPPEPLLWVGDPKHVQPDGSVAEAGAYPTSWRTTQDSGWSMFPRNTSSYVAGAAQLFPRECYSSPAQAQTCVPSSAAQQAEVINGAATLFAEAFRFGGALGVKRAVGNELPLARPKGLEQQTAFQGAFTRLQRAGVELDYYWHWGGEVGHGYDDSAAGMEQFASDLNASARAMEAVGADWQLATCGWELNAGYLAANTNASVALSTLDSGLGWTDTNPQFQNITSHKKWSIPWLEDDGGLIGAELWADRIMCHARTAAGYGVEGLMGITWRTLETSLTARALATVAWNVSAQMEDLYNDFATTAFGPIVGPKAAAILAGLDSFPTHTGNGSASCRGRDDSGPRLPRAGLICCGRWRPDDGAHNPHDQGSVPDASAYAFAEEFMALRDELTDPAALAQFDLWAFQLRYHAQLAALQRSAHAFQAALSTIGNISDASARQSAARTRGVASLGNVSRCYEAMMTSLMRFASTQGELGMVAMQENMNWRECYHRACTFSM